MALSKVFQLHCSIQHYNWGKLGDQSEVASLVKNVCPHFRAEENKPYAELWMGTHPSGPSVIMTPDGRKGQTLSHVLQENPAFLGRKVEEKFGFNLPFLFKVLSVNTALSIQAHPNKILAEELHKLKPDLYKDPNHKPEMALALTPFEALCGFRPFHEIYSFLKDIPELASLVGSKNVEQMKLALNQSDSHQKEILKNNFTALMTASKANVEEQLKKLITRILKMEGLNQPTSDVLGELLLKVHKDFPGDIGCFAIYFLNYLKMKPGEAIFLGANEAHAYLYGDCIEIMACSDNTVRAGLTPKFLDVQVLCDMLTYECTPAKDKLFLGISGPDPYTTVYDPPIPDFTLAKIQVPNNVKKYTFTELDSASILLVVQGCAEGKSNSGSPIKVQRGTVLFIAANESLPVEFTQEDNNDLLAFRGYCQL